MNETTEKTGTEELNHTAVVEELGWDSVIEADEPERVLLPEGDYNMTVSGLQRASHPGSANIPACPKARLSLRVQTETGSTTVYQDIFITHDREWSISEFFRCLGMKKHGERIRMDWDHVEGKKGRIHLKPRTYTGRDGNEHTGYDVKFMDWKDEYFPPEPVKLEEGHTGRMADEELPF